MEKRLQRRDLIAYAFLSQGIYGSDDRLSGLLPLFEPVVTELKGQIFDPAVLAERVNSFYPWSINSDVAENLVPRFQAVGWLTQVISEDGHALFRYQPPQEQTGEHHNLVAVEQRLHEIGEAFQEFIKILSPLTAVGLTVGELEELLLRWIVEKRAFDRELLIKAVKDDMSAPALPKDLLSDDDVSNDGIFSNEEHYLCARFIGYISHNNHEMFDYITQIAAVALVTEVVIDTAIPRQQDFSFHHKHIFYDAPFLLDCLGSSGQERYNNASFIHNHLLKFDAVPAVFDHSVEEAIESLKAVLKMSWTERHGPTAEALRKGHVMEDYIRDIAYRIDDYLSKNSIARVHMDLEAYPNDHRFFDKETLDDFLARIRWDRLTARERDALSVAYVMRKRRGRKSIDVTAALPILLTRNAALCDIATRFCREREFLNDRDVGPAVHQRQMASIIWIVVGSDERKELARRDLIQRCADVVRCRPEIIQKAREQLRRMDLDKGYQFEALLTRPRATQLMMDLTLGAERVLTSDNLDAIFERIRESAADDIHKKTQEEITTLKHRHREEKKQLTGKVGVAEARVESLSETIEEQQLQHARLVEAKEKESSRLTEEVANLREKDKELLSAWIRSAQSQASDMHSRIDKAIYAIFGVSAFASAGLLLIGAPVWSAVAAATVTVVSFLVNVAEKYKVIPLLGGKSIFRRQVNFIAQRAREANRQDLLHLLDCSFDHRTLQVKPVEVTTLESKPLGEESIGPPEGRGCSPLESASTRH